MCQTTLQRVKLFGGLVEGRAELILARIWRKDVETIRETFPQNRH
jgi:hypothetical protein